MDLTVKDVAELLNVSEKTVRQLVMAGQVPFYRLKGELRFNRIEIEDWMINRQKGIKKKEGLLSLKTKQAEKIISSQIGTQAYGLYRSIYKGDVLNNVPGNTKEEVIGEAVKLIAKNIKSDAEVLKELLLDRERLMPTSLNHGIAVPHTRDFLLKTPFDVVFVAYPSRPIEYGALDGLPVHTLFFLFACEDKRHLRLLAKLAHLTRNEEVLQFLKTRPAKTELLTYVKKWEGCLNLGVPATAAV